MRKRLSLLWVLIVAQLVVVVLVWWPSQQGVAAGKPLLAVTPTAVTRITLSAGQKGGKDAVTLAKKDGKTWQLPGDHGGFPANAGKVKHLLTKVASLQPGLPIAVTPDAAKRFHVAKSKFATRLVLTSDGSKFTLFVGDSAGANRLYVRKAGDNNIYAVNLPSWLVSTDVTSWENDQLLALDPSKIDQVTFPKVALARKNDAWQSTTATNAKLDATKTGTLVKRLAHADFESVAGHKGKFSLPAGPAFKVTVKTGDKTLTYHFASKPGKKTAKDKNPQSTWYLTRSDLPWVFKIAPSLADDFRNASVDTLKATAKAAKTSKADAAAQG